MMRAYLPALPPHIIERAVKAAFLEDLGEAGDITSQATIGPGSSARLPLFR